MKQLSASLYPSLPDADTAPSPQVAENVVASSSSQAFRLQKIGELESHLCLEVESHRMDRCYHEKYRRAVNALDGTCACAALGIICISTGVIGVPCWLLASVSYLGWCWRVSLE